MNTGSFLRMDKEVAEAAKFDRMKWENNQSLFVMINQSGSVRPIYKDLKDVPKGINSLFDLLAEIKFGKSLVDFSSMN